MVSTTDGVAYEAYPKLLPRRTGQHLVISDRWEYTKINNDDIRNTVLVSRLANVARERRWNMGVMSGLRTSTDTNPVKAASIEEDENTNSVQRIVGPESKPTET